MSNDKNQLRTAFFFATRTWFHSKCQNTYTKMRKKIVLYAQALNRKNYFHFKVELGGGKKKNPEWLWLFGVNLQQLRSREDIKRVFLRSTQTKISYNWLRTSSKRTHKKKEKNEGTVSFSFRDFHLPLPKKQLLKKVLQEFREYADRERKCGECGWRKMLKLSPRGSFANSFVIRTGIGQTEWLDSSYDDEEFC